MAIKALKTREGSTASSYYLPSQDNAAFVRRRIGLSPWPEVADLDKILAELLSPLSSDVEVDWPIFSATPVFNMVRTGMGTLRFVCEADFLSAFG